jgi:hypothetical protein
MFDNVISLAISAIDYHTILIKKMETAILLGKGNWWIDSIVNLLQTEKNVFENNKKQHLTRISGPLSIGIDLSSTRETE